MSLDINSSSDNKKFNSFFSALASLFVVFVLFFSMVFIVGFSDNVSAGSSYTPAAPSGITSGDLDADYEFLIYTMDVGSSWMFDWGDGTYSDWIVVGDSDTFVSQQYSWSSSGVYEVRVKHRSVYLDESSWSPSLTVVIDLSTDLDDDGYSNEMEAAYGTDSNDPDDYPLDTDGDGTPDESPDEGFTGDLDDDGDGLSDEIEILLGLDSKDGSDVISVIIGGTTHFIVDIDGNGYSDTFYNSNTAVQTKTKTENGKILLDVNNDAKYEYAYDSVNGITRYEEPFEIPWLYVIVAIILIALLVIFVLIKKGVIYLYEEEYIVEE